MYAYDFLVTALTDRAIFSCAVNLFYYFYGDIFKFNPVNCKSF